MTESIQNCALRLPQPSKQEAAVAERYAEEGLDLGRDVRGLLALRSSSLVGSAQLFSLLLQNACAIPMTKG